MPEEPPQKRAVIYTRVSTEDQAREGFSLDAQRNRLTAYCEAKGWLTAEFYTDEGQSGRTDDRPAYQKMLHDRENWDVMVVLKMDRIHRNSKNFTIMMDQLNSWGKEFASTQESFDTTTAMGRFVMDIIQRIAQLESEQIGERVRSGMQQKAQSGGGYLGFNIPYGYDYEKGSLTPKPEEAPVLVRIFDLYLSGLSLGKIAAILNADQVPTKRGKTWAKTTVMSILRNPVYCGFTAWEGELTIMDHPPLVSVIDFNSVQERRLRHARNKDSRRYAPCVIDEAAVKLVPLG
jgi:site-specific DNA recombinase